MQRLLDHLAGKNVTIVGNASSLLAHAFGGFIDGHDVVVRMNRGIPVDPVAQGRRFDVCCFSTLRDHGAVLTQAAPPFAVWMSPKFRDEYDGSIDVCFYPLQFWQALHNRLNARPSVGAMTVDLVSRSDARAVSVIGFDFKRSGTFYAAAQHIGPHDYGAESRYVRDTCAAKAWRFIELGVSQTA